MDAEELAEVREVASDAVSSSPTEVSGLSEASEEPDWVFGEAQYTEVMTLGSSMLATSVFSFVFSMLAVGCILGYVLTHDWRV